MTDYTDNELRAKLTASGSKPGIAITRQTPEEVDMTIAIGKKTTQATLHTAHVGYWGFLRFSHPEVAFQMVGSDPAVFRQLAELARQVAVAAAVPTFRGALFPAKAA